MKILLILTFVLALTCHGCNSCTSDRRNIESIVEFGGNDGHGDADRYMEAMEALLMRGDAAIPALKREWKKGKSHEYMMAFFLAQTSYKEQLRKDLVSLLESSDEKDRDFAAYTMGKTYKLTGQELTEEQKRKVLLINFLGLRDKRYNDVGAEFEDALEAFTKTKNVPYGKGVIASNNSNKSFQDFMEHDREEKIRFWKEWIQKSEFNGIIHE